MPTREDILHRREQIIALAGRYGASDVRLFGSLARGDATENSDVDLLVRFEPGRSLLDQGGLLMDLRQLLGADRAVRTDRPPRGRTAMRSDRLLLEDILDAIDEVAQYVPADRAAFDASPPLQSHIYRHVMIVGEAAWRLSQPLKDANPQVPWKQIAGMRHIMVHDYC